VNSNEIIMLERIRKLLKKTPNLKAREIAKQLGVDRTEVSSLMHKKKGTIFQQNDVYEWSLLPDELEIIFAGQWVDCSSFESSLSNANLDIGSVQKVKFILPDGCKFFLETIARFLALCNQFISSKKEVTIDLSNNNKSMHYWNRVGFFDHLSEKATVLPDWPKSSTAKSKKGNSEKVVEFGAVDPKTENKDLINQLTDAFVARQNKNKNYENPIFTILAEMIKNVKDHSESKLKGFAALQKYDGYSGRLPHIQVIVSDSGKGIAATLRPSLKEHYPKFTNKTDLELVKMVLEGKQLSKHGSNSDSGHGLGFKSSHEKASMFNAKYSIRQSNFSLEFEFKTGKLQPAKERSNLVPILGTHICFDFDIDDSGSDCLN